MRNGRTGRRRMPPTSRSPSGRRSRAMRPGTRRRASIFTSVWRGRPISALAELKKAGMPVICDQNAVRPGAIRTIRSSSAGCSSDEPDNAQALPGGKGYGPPVLPAKIIEEYEAFRKADPSRPVFLSLGQAVAWDGYHGRGGRTNHPEDYAEYVKGCDIASFDIYPVAHEVPAGQGQAGFRRPGRRAAGQVDRRPQARLELHRMHADRRRTTRPRPSRSKRKSGSAW